MNAKIKSPLKWPTEKIRTPVDKIRMARFHNWSSEEAQSKLEAELRKAKATDVTITYNASSRSKDEGVAVFFNHKGRPVVLACDKWKTIAENLWAIACHIHALRGQERWGVGTMESALAGHLLLPQSSEGKSCWEILGVEQGAEVDQIRSAYRNKAKECHPDRGGSDESMMLLNQALEQAIENSKG